MSILTGPQIEKEIESGRLKIEPYHPERVQSNSYDLALGPELVLYDASYVFDIKFRKWDQPHEKVTIPPEGFVLPPYRLALGCTIEFTDVPNHVPLVEGKSSIGRGGLFIHVTAGFGDTGFRGKWTLELFATNRVRLYAGEPIAQLYLHEVVGEIRPYQGRYLDSTEVTPAR